MDKVKDTKYQTSLFQGDIWSPFVSVLFILFILILFHCLWAKGTHLLEDILSLIWTLSFYINGHILGSNNCIHSFICWAVYMNVTISKSPSLTMWSKATPHSSPSQHSFTIPYLASFSFLEFLLPPDLYLFVHVCNIS